MNLSTVKWAQSNKTQSRELLGLFICVCIALRTIALHTILHRTDLIISLLPPDNRQCSDDAVNMAGNLGETQRHIQKA